MGKSYFNQICLCKLIFRSVLGLQSVLGDLVVKNPPANARDVGLISGLGRSPGEGNGNSLQYSCLGNPIDTGAWWAIVLGVAKESDMTWRLSNNKTSVSSDEQSSCPGDGS